MEIRPSQESDDSIGKIVQEIMRNRNKILDDFCKAYLAENMKDTPIKDLVLNEQCIECRYRWWFSVKDQEYMN